jgi:hypothetical protein
MLQEDATQAELGTVIAARCDVPVALDSPPNRCALHAPNRFTPRDRRVRNRGCGPDRRQVVGLDRGLTFGRGPKVRRRRALGAGTRFADVPRRPRAFGTWSGWVFRRVRLIGRGLGERRVMGHGHLARLEALDQDLAGGVLGQPPTQVSLRVQFKGA